MLVLEVCQFVLLHDDLFYFAFNSSSMSAFEEDDNDFTSLTGPPLKEEMMSLEEIQHELAKITDLANQGLRFDEKRMDYLLNMQMENEEYQALVAQENEEWRQSVDEFTFQCLERMRTFIPVNIFSCSYDDLVKCGLPAEIAKRILQKQCLWLCRLSSSEIARLHESDLLGRYNSTGQSLDVIETAAIFASLPTVFNNDATGKKTAWRENIEETLKQMLIDNDNDVLPVGRVRNPAYGGLQFGPVKDTTSVRKTVVVASGMDQPRTSFTEVCRTNSIVKAVMESGVPTTSNNNT